MLAGWQHAVYVAPLSGLSTAVWILRERLLTSRAERERERRGREEMEAYTRFDARVGRDGDIRGLARRVCGVVAARSGFGRVAIVARDAEGKPYVAANEGMEGSTVAVIEGWALREAERERLGDIGTSGGVRIGAKSLVVPLPEGGRVIIVPLQIGSGRTLGAILVRADSLMQVRRRMGEEAVVALEALASKLCRAMENAELAERLIRAEKLAGLGMLAGGVAHALNNPLTAVLGFAELILETAVEPHVRCYSENILDEAKRMRDTVQRLIDFWRPPVQRVEIVDVPSLVENLANACESRLAGRGVSLIVQIGHDAPGVRGNRDRLRQMLEHLLNNAAQAVESSALASKENAIRLTVTHDTRAVQIIVSDTGPGFREPGRAFDLFYTTQAPGEGYGLGLSICYGIVREHGGEISAFNLHPRGAAVVVELPVREILMQETTVTGEVA